MTTALATDAVDEALALATFLAAQARITEAVAALVRDEVGQMVHATEAQMAFDWVRHIADNEPDYDEVEEPDRIERD